MKTAHDLIPAVAIVLTKNEETQIEATLRTLSAFESVVVVDSNSSDRTVEIARDAGAEVINFTWNGTYPKKKQWSLDHATNGYRWALLLDADEMPTPELVGEIRGIVSRTDSNFTAWDVPLSYNFAGRTLRHGHRVYKRSLLRVDSSRFIDVKDQDLPGIKEVEGHYQPSTSGQVGRTRQLLVHDDKDPVGTWFDRHNRYSDWEAHLAVQRDLFEAVASQRSSQGQLFGKLPFKPVIFFVFSYFVRLGFLDGRAGFDYAFALSTYYWQIGVKKRELKRKSAPEQDER